MQRFSIIVSMLLADIELRIEEKNALVERKNRNILAKCVETNEIYKTSAVCRIANSLWLLNSLEMEFIARPRENGKREREKKN